MSREEELLSAINTYAEQVLVVLHEDLNSGRSKSYLNDVVEVVKNRFGHNGNKIYGGVFDCIIVLANAGYVHGSVDFISTENIDKGISGNMIMTNNDSNIGESEQFVGRRWFSLTEKGDYEATLIKREAQQLSGKELPNDQGFLHRFYQSTVLKPGVFGVGIDLKKLFKK
ncbi:MAG: hypothetical protein B6D75_01285 [gamma proteobacterium symbiont of Stewartia floridana]|nr:MAG: hypothetical protein B6D75_01285 [gamma proteobacterium symbiont of Stewartia floridana]